MRWRRFCPLLLALAALLSQTAAPLAAAVHEWSESLLATAQHRERHDGQPSHDHSKCAICATIASARVSDPCPTIAAIGSLLRSCPLACQQYEIPIPTIVRSAESPRAPPVA